MRTRPEEVQAYRFVTRRIVSALLSGEPETTDLPMRRLGMSMLGGAMVALVVLAAIGAYGFLHPGGATTGDKQFIIERETGARFISNEGSLYPVLNYTSARLIVGSDAKVQNMSRNSLMKWSRGVPVGIYGAPDSIPDKKLLVGLPWSVCTTQAKDTTAAASALLVGRRIAGGSGLGDGAVILTVAAGTHAGEQYLLVGDVRMRVRDGSALVGINLSALTPISVAESFINAVPAGPDLVAPTIANLGNKSNKKIANKSWNIGQVFKNGDQYFVLLADGLARIGAVSAALLMTNGSQAESISAEQAGQNLLDVKIEAKGFPAVIPPGHPSSDKVRLCSTFLGDGSARRYAVEIYDPVPSEFGDLEVKGTPENAGKAIGKVMINGGRGALVRTLPAPGVNAQTTGYLITDQGIKYPLVKSEAGDAAALLGFGGVNPTPVPAELLELVPSGPTLDPAAAGAPVANSTMAPSASAKPGPSKNG